MHLTVSPLLKLHLLNKYSTISMISLNTLKSPWLKNTKTAYTLVNLSMLSNIGHPSIRGFFISIRRKYIMAISNNNASMARASKLTSKPGSPIREHLAKDIKLVSLQFIMMKWCTKGIWIKANFMGTANCKPQFQCIQGNLCKAWETGKVSNISIKVASN